MNERNKGILLAGLVVVAGVVWYFERGNASVASTSAETGEMSYKPLAVENPALQRDKQRASQKTDYKGNGRDLFSEIAPPPPDDASQVSPDARSAGAGQSAATATADAAGQRKIFWLRHDSQRHGQARISQRRRQHLHRRAKATRCSGNIA